jgi:hypothetical protein
MPEQAGLGVQAEHPGRGARGDDDGASPELPPLGPHAERRGREIDPLGVGRDVLGAEAGRLGAELLHQLGAHDPVGETGIVLDIGGEHELPAGAGEPLDDQRVQVGTGGVDGGGQAGRAGPDDDDVADGVHHGEVVSSSS